MTDVFADIIIDISHEKLDHTFQYRIPEQFREKICTGSVVVVPFGKGNRPTKGYVVGISETLKLDAGRIKDISEILTDTESLNGEDRLVTLAAWMRETYGSTMIQALRTVIPVKKKVQKRISRTVSLIVDQEEALDRLNIFRKKHQNARERLMLALLEEGELPYELVIGKLHISTATLKYLEQEQLIHIHTETEYRRAFQVARHPDIRRTLNAEQREAVEGIWQQWKERQKRTALLFGITGSGKTEVYMELIDRTIREGRQAIVLIPEIALTYQTVMRFYRRFGDRISIIHSRLSAGERYDQFVRAAAGEIDIMIGPRSALFTPFPHLGLIVMDEEHESSYQSETMPRYHAREAAIRRAELENASVLLGSATPSLESYSRALSGEYGLYRLTMRAAAQSHLPSVEIVDLREELRKGNRTILSDTLRENLTETLERKQQAMLFLNRRGYAGFLSCRSCGQVITCPHCDVSLSVHRGSRMVCHYCGYEQPRPKSCPNCGSEFLSGFGIGTQQVEDTVKNLFPEAKVLRMDMDTTREKDGHEKILSAFSNHEADILIGTQMIVKGHDFPAVTLVGVLAADLSLHTPDYRAAERTFQLLTQAAGRAGRGELAGKVVIQTYDPEHYAVTTAAVQDYEAFYREEISYRLLGNYPPVRRMLSVHVSCPEEDYLNHAMEYLAAFAARVKEQKQMQEVAIFGPAPESIAKIADQYRMVLYIKAEKKQELSVIKQLLEKYIEINRGFERVNVTYDLHQM
ncbi:MAG: primosomal protein N' [Eubacteriales bacterium]|nr:primosomal protein N' [Eubacteriales bacterium]